MYVRYFSFVEEGHREEPCLWQWIRYREQTGRNLSGWRTKMDSTVLYAMGRWYGGWDGERWDGTGVGGRGMGQGMG